MAVKKIDELLNSIKSIVSDLTSDESLNLLEDVEDTFNSLSNNDGEDWKAKYEENDKMWREKYRDRFFNKGTNDCEKNEEKNDDKKTPPAPAKFEDLFKEEV